MTQGRRDIVGSWNDLEEKVDGRKLDLTEKFEEKRKRKLPQILKIIIIFNSHCRRDLRMYSHAVATLLTSDLMQTFFTFY